MYDPTKQLGWFSNLLLTPSTHLARVDNLPATYIHTYRQYRQPTNSQIPPEGPDPDPDPDRLVRYFSSPAHSLCRIFRLIPNFTGVYKLGSDICCEGNVCNMVEGSKIIQRKCTFFFTLTVSSSAEIQFESWISGR